MAKTSLEANSILHRAAMLYAYRNAPPELKAKFAEGFHRFFPGLKVAGHDDDGRPYYTAASVAEALGASETELCDMAEGLRPEERGEGVTIHRVN